MFRGILGEIGLQIVYLLGIFTRETEPSIHGETTYAFLARKKVTARRETRCTHSQENLNVQRKKTEMFPHKGADSKEVLQPIVMGCFLAKLIYGKLICRKRKSSPI